jgi:hypothetical protein
MKYLFEFQPMSHVGLVDTLKVFAHQSFQILWIDLRIQRTILSIGKKNQKKSKKKKSKNQNSSQKKEWTDEE